jgi:hypothetical protein
MAYSAIKVLPEPVGAATKTDASASIEFIALTWKTSGS